MKISKLISDLTNKLKENSDVDVDIEGTLLYEFLYPIDSSNLFKITIGDWSEDGHGGYEEFVFSSVTPLKDIQDAFKKSCEKLDLGVDINQHCKNTIFCAYEDNIVDKSIVDLLQKSGINTSKIFCHDTKDKFVLKDDDLLSMSFLLLEIAKLELDFEYEFKSNFEQRPKNKIKPFNGWWTGNDMNLSIGYGLWIN